MARFTIPLDVRNRQMARNYGMNPTEPAQQQDYGMFGRRGFWGNIEDYYGLGDVGGAWRNLYGRARRSLLGDKKQTLPYFIRPGWGGENIRTMMDIMENQ